MITTEHQFMFCNAKKLSKIPDQSMDLVVTSPPYPMIQMWDELFKSLSAPIKKALNHGEGNTAFSLMHEELDAVWTEMYRVLKNGAFLCINIGDAVRTIDDKFQLFSNHSRILSFCTSIGFDALPVILWRKQTNAPNKFMGSGMLPAGAYITLEHEFVLVFRKGGKRCFDSAPDKLTRHESAYFWEERNKWFSDIWDFKGTTQKLNNDKVRKRSGAFPLELAYRMIHMYSVHGDTVLDPFLGTGTTILAAMAACRNSVGVELDKEFKDVIVDQIQNARSFLNSRISERITSHLGFIEECRTREKDLKYLSAHHGFPVMTRQEINMILYEIKEILMEPKDRVRVSYQKISGNNPLPPPETPPAARRLAIPKQQSLGF
ncbi:MAG: site-specific DNA-methyltransferase [Desulfatirhabdiaceae bacterium]|nr:site-specific DNA-methyltransferase [Desulfatirhabdiaceae bacterium]